ncbi:MAG: hypothetical protein Q7S42_00410 [Candidatus Omnitrophota bacterium]|nr:hypothetical protein [Candidatus Omnitrophota bacterium]
MSKILIIHRRHLRRLRGLAGKDVHFYFLCQDYEGFFFVRKAWPSFVSVDQLNADFSTVYADIRSQLLSAWGQLNARYSSFVWWSGQLASKSVSANVFAERVVHYFRAKRVIKDDQGAIIFVVDSPVLAGMVADLAREAGRLVDDRFYWERLFIVRFSLVLARIFVKCALVVWGIINRVIAARRFPLVKKPLEPVVLMRTWVTEGSFDQAGRFRERNFGELPEYFMKKGYDVLTLPMFFNLKRPISDIYRFLAFSGRHIVIPEKYLTLMDYLRIIWDALRLNLMRVSGLIVRGEDLSPLINEVIARSGFDVSLLELNAASYLLPRLKKRGIDFSMVIYPFEGNAPEHPFIIAIRRSFPKAKILGYQHSVLYQDQLAYHLADAEKLVRPLPDKIVCSGPIYPHLLAQNGFSSKILMEGPNLRFTRVHIPVVGGKTERSGVLLPLTFSYVLAFDLFLKVYGALGDKDNFKIFVRSHPLLDRQKLGAFLNKIGAKWEFADEGLMQNWLGRVKAVITTGASVTTLEAVVAGVPVIRVVPSLTFHYDCFHSLDYPVPIAYNMADIWDRLGLIEHLFSSDSEVFTRFAKETLAAYFCHTDTNNIGEFLKGE